MSLILSGNFKLFAQLLLELCDYITKNRFRENIGYVKFYRSFSIFEIVIQNIEVSFENRKKIICSK